jgi:hypothetical protein
MRRSLLVLAACVLVLAPAARANHTAPSGLTVTAKTHSSVSLDWSNYTRYTPYNYRVHLYNAAGVQVDARWSSARNVANPPSQYTWTRLQPRTSYQFAVAARARRAHLSQFSARVSVTTDSTEPPPPPPAPPPADSDGDGVPDSSDQCPNRPGPAPTGCPPAPPPDRDGDGVPDSTDQCPDVHGQGQPSGCPPVIPPPPTGTLFHPLSYHNKPLADNAPLDPNSANAVQDLVTMTGQYVETINGANGVWSTPVYTVPAGQATRQVINLNSGHPPLNEAYSAVPLPAGAQPESQSDHHLTVYQPSTDKLWEFWGFSYNSSGQPQARYGGRMCSVSTNPGHFITTSSPCNQVKGWGATATSIPLLAGLIRLPEGDALNIPHSLALSVPKSNCQFRSPAQRTDGGCSPGVQHLPPGARLRLPASLNVDALPMHPLGKAIARAVQRYGMHIMDRSGSIALYADQDNIAGSDGQKYVASGGRSWSQIRGGSSAEQVMAGFPWSQLQMLTPAVDP